MGRYQFMFYATARDLTPVLSLLEAQKKLQYTPTRHVVSDKAQIYLSYADIPDFGRTNNPTAVTQSSLSCGAARNSGAGPKYFPKEQAE